MNKFKLGVIATVLPFLMAGSPPVFAQDQPPPPPAGDAQAQAYTPEQLDQMLAPIALYPDQLLTQILMASTYPLQIVEAQRWLQDPNNAALRGDAIVAALTPMAWDPSVKALVPFPQVVSNLSEHLDWTQSLGVAFVNQQADVMAQVQVLRGKAQAAGKLQSTPQMVVQQQGPAIVIEPANPQVVYVPYYDPAVVYGPWAYPAYPPYFWAPGPGIVVGGLGLGIGIGFGVGFGIVGPYWGWAHPVWGGGGIYVNNVVYNRIGGPGWHGDFRGGGWHHVGPIGGGPRGFAGRGPGFGPHGGAGFAPHGGPGGHPAGGFGAHAGAGGGHPGFRSAGVGGGHPGGGVGGGHPGGGVGGGHPGGGAGGHPNFRAAGAGGGHPGGGFGGHPGGGGGHPNFKTAGVGGGHPGGGGGHPGGGGGNKHH